MKFINENTGVVIEVNGKVEGNGWKPVEKKATPKKKGAEKK